MLPDRFARPFVLLACALAAVAVQAQPAAAPRIEKNGPPINITLFAQVPASASFAPRARINHLKPLGDGSGRLFVNDLNGPLNLIADGKATRYLDLSEQFKGRFTATPGWGTGFASIAVHPDFARNGRFYTAHSEFSGSATADFTPPESGPIRLQGVVIEWMASNPAAPVFAGKHRELMRIDLPHTIHGMQEIAFNPHARSGTPDYGMLYICIGDGGTTLHGNPDNTHRLDSVLGSILRIDPLGSNSANRQYGTPVDNPWVGQADPRIRGEIWAYGFRNPHRISWDRAAEGAEGKVLVGDIGEHQYEEVNLLVRGGNYGWNKREGHAALNPKNRHALGTMLPLPADDASLGYIYPVAQYDHREGDAIVGGYVYRGAENAALQGHYLFGDIKQGRLFTLDAAQLQQGRLAPISEPRLMLDGRATTMTEIIGDSARSDIRFGYDDADNLYLLEKRQGRIYKIVRVPGQTVP